MRKVAAVVVAAALLLAAIYHGAGWLAQRAYRQFSSGDSSGAVHNWSRLKKAPWLRDYATFNTGVAAYRTGNYSSAIADFRASSRSKTSSLRGKALYNLGTAELKSAVTPGTAANREEVKLRIAVQALRQSLELVPADLSAAANLELAKARLSTISAKSRQRGKAHGDSAEAHRDPQQVQRAKPAGPMKQQVAAARPGPAGELDRQGAKKRRLPDTKEALRMLDEARGREVLPSATVSSRNQGAPTAAEKEW